MSTFDLAVGIDAATMNQAAVAAYNELYPEVFCGSQDVNKEGIEFQVSWDVKVPPTFVLEPPARSEVLLRSHLRELTPPGTMGRNELRDAYRATLESTTFQMLLSDMTMMIEGDGGKGSAQVKVTIVVQAESTGGQMSLRPIKAVATTDNPSDQWFINTVILPQAMTMGTTLLSGITLPPLTFPGVPLTPPVILITPRNLIAMANLNGKPVPQPPFPSDWPQSPFFALMSDEAKLLVAHKATADINGKKLGRDGSVDIGIGTAQYSATAVLGNVAIGSISPGSFDMQFKSSVSGNVNAGVKIGCTTFGVNYNLYATPTPSGTIGMSINGTTVRATTRHLDIFVLLINPSGNPFEWLLSAMTTPLLQVITAAFSPLITKIFEDISFDVWNIPDFPIDIKQIHLVVRPIDVHFALFNGMTSIEGTATITGGPKASLPSKGA